MTWNIAPESVSLIMLAIIWVYSRKGSRLPTLKNRIFQGCLMVTFCAMLTNILSTFMIYHYLKIPLWMTWTVTLIYFILTPLMGLVYFLYVVSYIYAGSIVLKRLILFGSLPGVLYTLAVLANPFTGSVFDISRAGGYTRGPLISVTYIVFYAYCAASLVVSITGRKRVERQIYGILTTFPILAVVVIVIQQLFPDIILSGSAATCALLIIYLHLQNRQISLDYLTNVPNRQELLDMLGLMIQRYPERKFTLLVVSLRDFRQINNTCGQHNGDLVLKSVCRFLCGVDAENVYRFSGDEFALLFSGQSQEQIKQCVEQISVRMKAPWEINDYRFVLSAVMGVIHHSDRKETLENIINSIEYAVYQAKSGKYGDVCYCDQEMFSKLERRRQIIQILKEKLDDQSFEMYYQPIYSVEQGTFLFGESLMRINSTPIGPVYPSEFIPIAEETGLIIEITYVILNKVCKFINRLLESGIRVGAIHVNFSAVQFSQNGLKERVLEIIRNNRTPASAVMIEFTESTLAENPQVVTEFAMEMKKHGICMGLDDFGTGYSNIASVISIPFHTIKLDKSLVDAAMVNRISALAVKNLVRTFKELGMGVIVEGVETEEQRKLMVEFGADQIQGYYYSRPLPEEEMVEFMKNGGGCDGQ